MGHSVLYKAVKTQLFPMTSRTDYFALINYLNIKHRTNQTHVVQLRNSKIYVFSILQRSRFWAFVFSFSRIQCMKH